MLTETHRDAHIYVDESIHDEAGFIVLAAACVDRCLNDLVFEALKDAGFEPGVDEFKSSLRMAGNDAAQKLRATLQWLLTTECKVAVAICGRHERDRLAQHFFALLPRLPGLGGGEIHLDQGIRVGELVPPQNWKVTPGENSKVVGGIQLADCAAHTIATILRSELSATPKMIAAADPIYEPEIEMAWQLWTWLRYALVGSVPVRGTHEDDDFEPYYAPFGLLISPECPELVRKAAMKRLASHWMGCIH